MEYEIKKDFIVVDGEKNISDYFEELLKEKVLVLEENNVYKGVITKHKILKWKLNPAEAKIKNYVKKIPLLKKNEINDLNLIDYLISFNINYVLIGANNRVKGYISQEDVIKVNLDKLEKVLVKEIVKENFPTIKEEEPISKAFHIIKYQNVDRLIVLDKNNNLVGIITITDLIKSLLKNYKKPRSGTFIKENLKLFKKPVKDFMSDNPLIVFGDTNLKECFEKMERENINSLIVVKREDIKTPIGLLDKKTILLYLKSLLKKEEELSITISTHNVVLDEEDIRWLKEKIKKIMKKCKKIMKNYLIHINIKKIKENVEDDLNKYLVRIHLIIPSKTIYVDIEDNSLQLALNRALKILDRQLMEYKEKISEKEIMEIIKELESLY